MILLGIPWWQRILHTASWVRAVLISPLEIDPVLMFMGTSTGRRSGNWLGARLLNTDSKCIFHRCSWSSIYVKTAPFSLLIGWFWLHLIPVSFRVVIYRVLRSLFLVASSASCAGLSIKFLLCLQQDFLPSLFFSLLYLFASRFPCTSFNLTVCMVMYVSSDRHSHECQQVSSWLSPTDFSIFGPAHVHPRLHPLLLLRLPGLEGIGIQTGLAAHYKGRGCVRVFQFHDVKGPSRTDERLSCSQLDFQRSHNEVMVRPNNSSPFYTHILQWCSPSLNMIDLVFSDAIWKYPGRFMNPVIRKES